MNIKKSTLVAAGIGTIMAGVAAGIASQGASADSRDRGPSCPSGYVSADVPVGPIVWPSGVDRPVLGPGETGAVLVRSCVKPVAARYTNQPTVAPTTVTTTASQVTVTKTVTAPGDGGFVTVTSTTTPRTITTPPPVTTTSTIAPPPA